jgi:hypothetical protein
MAHRRLLRAGLWRRLDVFGLERFELARDGEGWALGGTILTGEGGSAEVRYEVVCDAGWRTRRTKVAFRDAHGERTLELTAADGSWSIGGHRQPTLDGCIDVDLEWSPATNTLPIRRVHPEVGARTGVLRMAWIRFPALTVELLTQEYRHTSAGRYLFESDGGSFRAEIDVDDEGLVTRYEGLWEREGVRGDEEPVRIRHRGPPGRHGRRAQRGGRA